jgi:hypothetical protein
VNLFLCSLSIQALFVNGQKRDGRVDVDEKADRFLRLKNRASRKKSPVPGGEPIEAGAMNPVPVSALQFDGLSTIL